MTYKNILFSGPPGCGKSTPIERIIQRIETPATGFFTREDVLLVHVSQHNRDELARKYHEEYQTNGRYS